MKEVSKKLSSIVLGMYFLGAANLGMAVDAGTINCDVMQYSYNNADDQTGIPVTTYSETAEFSFDPKEPANKRLECETMKQCEAIQNPNSKEFNPDYQYAMLAMDSSGAGIFPLQWRYSYAFEDMDFAISLKIVDMLGDGNLSYQVFLDSGSESIDRIGTQGPFTDNLQMFLHNFSQDVTLYCGLE